MSLAKITSKGQITVPKSIREHLSLHPGDQVEFRIDPEGHVIMTPKTLDVTDIFGMIKANKKINVEDMDKGIHNFIKSKHECN